jgi:glycosyltransferase involved in cell wall biosynthesis
VNGILIGDEPGAAAESIRRLDADPAEAARLGTNARRTIEERFTVERMVEETIAVYRRVLNA